MRTSQEGINLIKRFEGCRLTAYRCPAGKITIGYGHTAGVKMGQTITQTQAESFLKDDLIKYEKLVEKYDRVYHWNQNQFDALVSFAFNIGSIDQLTNKGKRDIHTISEKMLEYNKITVNGKKVPSSGLYDRRVLERTLFLKSVGKKNLQAASTGNTHVQLNYQSGQIYKVHAVGLCIRTKKADQAPEVLPTGNVLGEIANGAMVKNQATARVGNAIWMYIGLDKRGREQWVCADTGDKAYIE